MYYGWYIVGGVVTAQFFLIGFFSFAFSLLVMPVQTAFEASRTEVMYSMTMATSLSLVASPVIGAMVDRYPVRWLLTAGAVVFGGCLLLMAEARTIYQFAVVFGVGMSLANLLLGPLTGSATISRWFTTGRGRALGIGAVGTSLGGIAIPILIAYWLAQDDWRSALQNLGYCVLLIVWPLMTLVMRDPPRDDPSLENARAIAPVIGGDEGGGAGATMAGILKHRAYWAIGLSMGLLFCTYSALLANLSPYAIGLGIEAGDAARLITVIAFSALAGKLVFGIAADRIGLRLSLWIAQGLAMLGLLILAQEPAYAVVVLASVIIGLAGGGMIPIWGAMLAAVFGVAVYGRVMGLMNPLIAVLVMPGYTFAGYMFDLTGSYRGCFLIFAGILVLAALALLALRLPAGESAPALHPAPGSQ